MEYTAAIKNMGAQKDHSNKAASQQNSIWWRARLEDGLMMAAILLLLMGYSIVSQASTEMTLDEVDSGQLLFKSVQSKNGVRTFQPAVLLDEEVNLNVSGLILTARLTQRFKNDTDEWLEAIYAFPLPENAALYLMELRIGERVIKGEIKEKTQAKIIYQKAKKAGKKAALVEQHRPNLFTNNIANIPPGETIEVTLEYNQVVDYQQGQFELRFPLTTTPRYMPGKAHLRKEVIDADVANEVSRHFSNGDAVSSVDSATGWAFPTDQVPDAHLISPFTIPRQSMPANTHRVKLTAEINTGFPVDVIDSVSHDVAIDDVGGVGNESGYKVTLKSGSSVMDRDFVLAWQPQVGSEPQAALFTEYWKGEQYSLLMVMPPQQLPKDRVLPREQVFVIDTSGSMGGESIRQAKDSLQKALHSLNVGDRFNVIEFNSATHSLYRTSKPADQHHVQEALNYVRGLKASGGTEMSSALTAALSGSVYPGYLRQVIFITDGSVGNETALFNQIEQDLGASRLFTIGIGSAPNSYFMRKAAEFGRGSFTYISDLNEVETKLEALFNRLSAPVLSDLALKSDSSGDDATAHFEHYPRSIGDLYLGDPVVQVVKHSNEVKTLNLTAKSMGMYESKTPLWEQDIRLEGAKQAKGIAAYWGRQKIESLIDSARFDSQATEETKGSVKQQVIDVALKHHLVSPYTSLVAVEQVVARPAEYSFSQKQVPQLLPKGSDHKMAHFPQTATSSKLYLLAGLICYMIGIGLYYLNGLSAPFRKRLV